MVNPRPIKGRWLGKHWLIIVPNVLWLIAGYFNETLFAHEEGEAKEPTLQG
jgi:hypothetical protein